MAENDKLRETNPERMRESADRKAEEPARGPSRTRWPQTERPHDQSDVRAKSSGHKKKTADKRNQ